MLINNFDQKFRLNIFSQKSSYKYRKENILSSFKRVGQNNEIVELDKDVISELLCDF